MRDPRADMGVGVGRIIGLKVEEYRQSEDPGWLAIRMAEAMNGQSQHNQDADSLRSAVLAERQKALQLQAVIFQLEERKRSGAPPSTSRMDPLNTYDLDTCREELMGLKKRAQELQEQVNEHVVESERCKHESNRLQRKIRELNAKKRQT
jgi:hypothetical protein